MIRYITLLALLAGCQNNSSGIWEETKSATRYLQRKGSELFKGPSESRMVATSEEFYEDEDEFIPLRDEDLKSQYVDYGALQPKEDPGAEGGKVPGIDQFKDPRHSLASIFRTVHFNTDDHILRGKEHLSVIKSIASHLKKNPGTYIFVAGHCDERASESYNLSLGTRRANYVRNALIKEGTNPDQIYTISYGKEKPLAKGHTRNAWQKNRRVEFKIFDRNRNIRTES